MATKITAKLGLDIQIEAYVSHSVDAWWMEVGCTVPKLHDPPIMSKSNAEVGGHSQPVSIDC